LLRRQFLSTAFLAFLAIFAPAGKASALLYTFDTGMLLTNLMGDMSDRNLYGVYEVYVRPAVMSDPYWPLGALPSGASRLANYDLAGAISPMPFPDSYDPPSPAVIDQWIAEPDVAAPPELLSDQNPFVHFIFNPADSLLALAATNPNMGRSYSGEPGASIIGDSVLNGRTTELMPADRTWGVLMAASGVNLGDSVTFLVTAFAVQFDDESAGDLWDKQAQFNGSMALASSPAPEAGTLFLTGTVLITLALFLKKRAQVARTR